jgi:hypothetical protein
LVVKLDQSKNKTSKLSTSAPNQKELSEFESESEVSVENSPLARLMSMLDYPVLKGNATLMDKMFTFEDLLKLDDKSVQMVLKEVASETLVLSLKGASQELRDKILSNMSSRAADSMREDLESRGPVRLRSRQNNREAEAEAGAAAGAEAEAEAEAAAATAAAAAAAAAAAEGITRIQPHRNALWRAVSVLSRPVQLTDRPRSPPRAALIPEGGLEAALAKAALLGELLAAARAKVKAKEELVVEVYYMQPAVETGSAASFSATDPLDSMLR